MEPMFLSFLARNQARSAPGNAHPPPRAGIPRCHQQNCGGMDGTIKCLNRALHAHPADGHCPVVVPVETAKETEGRFHLAASHSDPRSDFGPCCIRPWHVEPESQVMCRTGQPSLLGCRTGGDQIWHAPFAGTEGSATWASDAGNRFGASAPGPTVLYEPRFAG